MTLKVGVSPSVVPRVTNQYNKIVFVVLANVIHRYSLPFYLLYFKICHWAFFNDMFDHRDYSYLPFPLAFHVPHHLKPVNRRLIIVIGLLN